MKKIEKDLKVLEDKARKAQLRFINKKNDYEAKVALPSLRKTVGKCFKYLNGYGGDKAKWYLYLKVISIDEKNLNYKCVEFQRTSLEIVEVKLGTKYNWRGNNYFNGSNYIEISNAEYNRAKKSLLKFMTDKLSM